MVAQRSFWQRMADRLGVGWEERTAGGDDAPLVSALEPLDVPTGGNGGALELRTSRPRFSWWRRRGERAALLRENAQRFGELIDAMQAHFRQQDERGLQLIESVRGVATILEQFADAQRGQGDSIRTMTEHIQTSGRHTAILAESLGRVPASLQVQAEALRAMAERIEKARAADAQLVDSLQGFGQAVDALNASGAAQVAALRHIHAQEDEQRAALTLLVAEQGRRFLIAMIVASVVGVAAVAGTGLALWLYLHKAAG